MNAMQPGYSVMPRFPYGTAQFAPPTGPVFGQLYPPLLRSQGLIYGLLAGGAMVGVAGLLRGRWDLVAVGAGMDLMGAHLWARAKGSTIAYELQPLPVIPGEAGLV